MQILVQKCNRGLNLNLKNLEALFIHGCCKSLSRWMMRFLQRKQHCPPFLPSSPTMKSNTRIVGMNATSTRQGPYCIPVCQMKTSHSKSSWSKCSFGGVWTTFSNAYSSAWWSCSYKGNFPSMPAKTTVKDISFYAPYIQIVIINIQRVKNVVNIWFT